jgi:hypothetical protein
MIFVKMDGLCGVCGRLAQAERERGIWTRDEEREIAGFGWKSWRAPPAGHGTLKLATSRRFDAGRRNRSLICLTLL